MAKHAVSLLALLCVVVGAHAATLRGVATSVPVVETTLGPVQGTVVSSGSGSGSAAQWLGLLRRWPCAGARSALRCG